jgi:hypothetical protein
VGCAAVLTIGIAACGSDSAKSEPSSAPVTTNAVTTAPAAATVPAGATLDEQRAAIVTRLLDDSTTFGYKLDEACIAGLVDDLSDADVSILAESATGGSETAIVPGSSAEALATKVFDCAQGDGSPELIAKAADVAITAATEGSTTTFDRACVEDAFSKLTAEQLDLLVTSNLDTTQQALQPVLYLMIPCASDGPSTS